MSLTATGSLPVPSARPAGSTTYTLMITYMSEFVGFHLSKAATSIGTLAKYSNNGVTDITTTEFDALGSHTSHVPRVV